MKRWKSLLLEAYWRGTLPYRACRNAWAAHRGQAPILVLFYHRVADDRPTPWTCTNQVFADEMHWLRERFDMISLAEVQSRMRQGFNPRPAVSITFDDGYAENCQHALPLLVRERIPCTYFVSTQFVFEGRSFPHDEHCGLDLRPNTVEQLQQLAAAGIEIGAHTRTHADIGRIRDPDRLRDEIVTAGEELQDVVGRPVRYFAFPYGQHANLSSAAFHLAHEAGYEGVCSAYGAYNFPGDDAFHIQRIHADAEPVRLKNWATIDPRKLGVRPFEYEPLRPEVTPEFVTT